MSTIYEDPGSFGLELVGEFGELRVYEGIYCHNWHIAVWQDDFGRLYYKYEDLSGKDFGNQPFMNLVDQQMLIPIVSRLDLEAFRQRLDEYWQSQNIPTNLLTSLERAKRNKRNRLIRKVVKRFYA